ncbi:MAG: hypothetical protein ABH804_00630 [archaeon]
MREGEYKRNLIDYCKKNLKKGYSSQTLRYALLNQGYSRVLVEGSLEKAHQELAQKAPVFKEKPKITHELYDSENKPVLVVKKPLWKRFLGL